MHIDLRDSSSLMVEEREEVIVEEHTKVVDSWWRRIARWSLYLIAGATPILFLPYTVPPTLVKQVVVSSLVFIAFIAWLGESLLSGRVYYKRTLVNAAFLLLVFALFFSTLFSSQALRGIVAGDIMGERLVSFLVFGLMFFLAGGALYSERESQTFTAWFLAGGFLLSIFSLIQIFLPKVIPFASLARVDVNTIGTTNALAVLLGLFFVFTLGLLTSEQKSIGRVARVLLYCFLAVSFVNLFVINFSSIWIGLIAALVVLLGLKFRQMPRAGEKRTFAKREHLGLLFLVLAVATFMILSGKSFIPISSIPAEVSPSYAATLSIAKQVLKSHWLLGSGPGTFGVDYSMFHDPSINQTGFWGVRFNAGAAFLPTALATMGVLGVFALVLFLLALLASLFRWGAKAIGNDPIVVGAIAAVVFGIFMWGIYTTTFAFQVALFAVIGLVLARINEMPLPEQSPSLFRISERAINFSHPWTTFIASLIIIFLMVGGVAFLYYSIVQYVAALSFSRGVDSFSQNDIPRSLDSLAKAVNLDSTNDQYYRTLSQALLAEVQSIIASAVNGQNKNAQSDFQSAVSSSISAGQRAVNINPGDSLNWASLGLVYQTIVPYIQGAENFAIDAYAKAASADPNNPVYPFNAAVTYGALADRASVLLAQSGISSEAANTLTKQRTDALKNAELALTRSLQLKPDYPEANYLLAQVLIREGDLPRAIGHVETVKQLAPFNIGVAFQLGVLYYQSSQFDKAKAEFLRAVAMNQNYSNARYFLGLLYDKAGQKQDAIGEFEKIQALNPDNQEVRTILANLKANKPALAGVSPPAPAPATRSTPPVKDSGTPSGKVSQ